MPRNEIIIADDELRDLYWVEDLKEKLKGEYKIRTFDNKSKFRKYVQGRLDKVAVIIMDQRWIKNGQEKLRIKEEEKNAGSRLLKSVLNSYEYRESILIILLSSHDEFEAAGEALKDVLIDKYIDKKTMQVNQIIAMIRHETDLRQMRPDDDLLNALRNWARTAPNEPLVQFLGDRPPMTPADIVREVEDNSLFGVHFKRAVLETSVMMIEKATREESMKSKLKAAKGKASKVNEKKMRQSPNKRKGKA